MAGSVENEVTRTSLWKILFLVLAFCIPGLPSLLLVRTLLYQPFNIPSASNEPNYMVGDYIFVSKFAYGYSRYSFSPFNVFSFEGRTGHSLPAAGDVVVFKYPGDIRVDYIKRVVGLPGDHIQMIKGVLNINGVPVELADVTLPPEYYDMPNTKFFRETLPSGRSYVISDLGRTALDDTQEYIVPPKHYFMLGDSRDNSQDSRFLDKVGYVPEENIVGRVSILVFNKSGISISNRPDEIYPK
ncbi:MAG: signal peptidase I [Aestuariivirga sp.]